MTTETIVARKIPENEHDPIFISNCRTALVKDYFFGESAAEKAMDY
jgi:hypothetical protein